MFRYKEFLDEAIKLKSQSRSKADDYLDDFHKTTKPHPFSDRERIVGNATMHVSKLGDEVHVHDIRSLKPKSGAGTKALHHARSLADKHGVKLHLIAKAYHKNKDYITSSDRLKKWYKKHGFKSHGGSNDDGYEMSYTPEKKHQ